MGRGAQIPDLTTMIDDLSRRIDTRGAQYSALENVILGRQLSAEIKPTGRPPSSTGKLIKSRYFPNTSRTVALDCSTVTLGTATARALADGC